jgi:hypothetical protein
MLRNLCLIFCLIGVISNISSQPFQLDLVVNSCSNYNEYISFNSGEVYVIFNFQNDTIVSKETNQPIETSTENLYNESIFIFPNPVENIITIETKNNKVPTRILILSLNGALIIDSEIKNNKIDLSNLLSGTYLLKLDIDYSKTYKFIKL